MPNIGVRMSDADAERLDRAAEVVGVSRSELVRRAVAAAVAVVAERGADVTLADVADRREALAALQGHESP